MLASSAEFPLSDSICLLPLVGTGIEHWQVRAFPGEVAPPAQGFIAFRRSV